MKIDETCFGRRKYNYDTVRAITWVFRGVERNWGRPIFQYSLITETLIAIIKTLILLARQSLDTTGEAYVRLGDEGFTHHAINHSIGFVNSRTVNTQIRSKLRSSTCGLTSAPTKKRRNTYSASLRTFFRLEPHGSHDCLHAYRQGC